MGDESSWMIDSSGELVAYPDPFKHVDQAQADAAIEAEHSIRMTKVQIEGHFVSLGFKLDEFDRNRMFLARGYESMRLWAESPEIELSWRVVQDLLRIQRHVLPLLTEQLGSEEAAITALVSVGISKVRALLPLLRDDQTAAQFSEVIAFAPSIPFRALVNEVKSRRGVESVDDGRRPAVFMAKVSKGESFHRVTITCTDTIEVYEVGKLHIKPKHWARWEARFGDFVQFEE